MGGCHYWPGDNYWPPTEPREEVPDARDQVGVDPTGPAEPTEGGDAHDDALDREQRGSSAGAHVTGPAPADAEPAHPVWGYPFPVAGPADLDHAIHAAANAIMALPRPMTGTFVAADFLARVAVEAAAPVLLQATRDRLADLEVAYAELYEMVEQIAQTSIWAKEWPDIRAPLAPPARGRAILDEVQRLRQVAEWAEWVGTSTATNAVGSASFCMACGGYRKAGHKDGCWLLAALDGPAAQEEGG